MLPNAYTTSGQNYNPICKSPIPPHFVYNPQAVKYKKRHLAVCVYPKDIIICQKDKLFRAKYKEIKRISGKRMNHVGEDVFDVNM